MALPQSIWYSPKLCSFTFETATHNQEFHKQEKSQFTISRRNVDERFDQTSVRDDQSCGTDEDVDADVIR